MKQEKALLHKIYKRIHEIKRSLTLVSYFDYIVPENVTDAIAPATKGKYIRYDNIMPSTIKDYFYDKNNKIEIKKNLRKWINYIAEDNDKIMVTAVNVLNENDRTKFAETLYDKVKQKKISDLDFYYCLFRYCLTRKDDLEEEEDNHNLIEFNEMVLTQYGVSGNTGKNIILQLAGMGSENPYILFEAGEIEYMRRNSASRDRTESHLEKAYGYYKRASELGFALADWSIGYFAQMCNEKAWCIKEFDSMTPEEKYETAIHYYKRAAQKGCPKAYNSLGNRAKTNKLNINNKFDFKPAKHYYYQAAIRNNIFGMFSYARELENELREKVINKQYQKRSPKDSMVETGKTMLKYFEGAASLGHPEANYRCALYYGHLSDNKTAMDDNFYLVHLNKVQSIKYIRKAIGINTYKICIDAYIVLLKYITTDEEMFEGTSDLHKIKNYFEVIERGRRLNDKQKVEVETLKKILKEKNLYKSK